MKVDRSKTDASPALKYHRHGTWDMIDVPVRIRSGVDRYQSSQSGVQTAPSASQLLFLRKPAVRHPAISEVCSKFESLTSKTDVGRSVANNEPVVRDTSAHHITHTQKPELTKQKSDPDQPPQATTTGIEVNLPSNEIDDVGDEAQTRHDNHPPEPDVRPLSPELTHSPEMAQAISADRSISELFLVHNACDDSSDSSPSSSDRYWSHSRSKGGHDDSDRAQTNEVLQGTDNVASNQFRGLDQAVPSDSERDSVKVAASPVSDLYASCQSERHGDFIVEQRSVPPSFSSEKSMDDEEQTPARSINRLNSDSLSVSGVEAELVLDSAAHRDDDRYHGDHQQKFGIARPTVRNLSEIFRSREDTDRIDSSSTSSSRHSLDHSTAAEEAVATLSRVRTSEPDGDDAILNEAMQSLSLNFHSDTDLGSSPVSVRSRSKGKPTVRFGGESVTSSPEPRLDMFEYPLIKHGRRGHRRRIYLTVDLGAGIIRWGNGRRWLQIEHILQIRSGKETPVLKSRPADDVDGRLCLSLVTRYRSLDLECKTEDERKAVQLTIMSQIIGYLRHHNVRAGWIRPRPHT